MGSSSKKHKIFNHAWRILNFIGLDVSHIPEDQATRLKPHKLVGIIATKNFVRSQTIKFIASEKWQASGQTRRRRLHNVMCRIAYNGIELRSYQKDFYTYMHERPQNKEDILDRRQYRRDKIKHFTEKTVEFAKNIPVYWAEIKEIFEKPDPTISVCEEPRQELPIEEVPSHLQLVVSNPPEQAA